MPQGRQVPMQAPKVGTRPLAVRGRHAKNRTNSPDRDHRYEITVMWKQCSESGFHLPESQWTVGLRERLALNDVEKGIKDLGVVRL